MHSGSIKSKEKFLVDLIFARITFILGWFWCLSLAFLIVTVSLYKEILGRKFIPSFWKIFPKYLLKIYTNSHSSEISLVFQSFIDKQFSKIVFKIVCKTPFWCFLIVSHKNFCLLHADRVASFFSFLYLFINLECS